jgi:uncharacterized protein (TIGR02646 family)
MRFINKGQEPQSFTDWKAQENDNWQPKYETMPGQIRSDLHNSLLLEQGFTCCYCGMGITKNISHIEHLYPRTKSDEDLKLDFNNLLSSCGFSEDYKKSENKNFLHCSEHCGIKKDDDLIAVSPLQPDCEEFFRYGILGEILPTEDFDKKQAASNTIKTLNLDNKYLKDMREGAIDGALQGLEELTTADIEILINSYEQPNELAFSFAIAYILGQYLPAF